MLSSQPLRLMHATTPSPGFSTLKGLICGLALSAALVSGGSAASAASYSESLKGDLSGNAAAPTSLGTLTIGDNFVVGSSIPSGDPIPGGHGALFNQDNDFFSFTIPNGDVLSQLELESDSAVAEGDRFFIGIYAGTSSPVDPSNPTPAGLLGYALPGSSQVGTDLLPALAASNESGFPPLMQHFSGGLGPGDYTVWVVDGDRPLNYDFDFAVAAAPEPGAWILMLVAIGLTGVALRRRQPNGEAAFASTWRG